MCIVRKTKYIKKNPKILQFLIPNKIYAFCVFNYVNKSATYWGQIITSLSHPQNVKIQSPLYDLAKPKSRYDAVRAVAGP